MMLTIWLLLMLQVQASAQTTAVVPDGNNTSDGGRLAAENSTGPASAARPTPTPGLHYVLNDSFSKLNNTTWNVSAYTPRSTFIDTRFLPSNVRFANGSLAIRSDVDNHTGGELKSRSLYTYGKYRASMRLNQTPGTYLTFFSYIWPGGKGGEKHNEIDIEVIANGTNSTAMLTTWYNGIRNTTDYVLPFDPSETYHVYGYDWYPDHVSFYVDDRLVWTSRSRIPVQPMYLYLNSWVVKDVPASHGDGINAQYVDWVTVRDNQA